MDYNIIWFILIVVLFIGYIILDGFDFGVGMLHYKAKTDKQRRINLNAIGPVWDGNEVWLITAGGALFAAFPHVYATVFSGFYIAFMLFLLVIIGRASAIEFRSKVESKKWRSVWDFIFHVSSYLIVLLLGVAFGNLIIGVPIAADMEYAGTFLGLLNPFSIFLALTAILLLRMHGNIFMALKTDGDYQNEFTSKIVMSEIYFVIFYIILTIWTLVGYPHMTENFSNPIWYIFPLLVLLCMIYIPIAVKKATYFKAFIASSLIILSNISLAAIGLFPNFVYSSPNPENSLTIYNASSSQQTLENMFIIACIGVPLVLIYSIVVYRFFSGKVELDEHSY
jgi:cytochrome bd ubiquinol oxidase subunit II